MKNGCSQCEQLPDDEMCLDCQIEMVSAELCCLQSQLEELKQKKEKNELQPSQTRTKKGTKTCLQ